MSPLSETIQGFKEIIAGKYDDIPESYFLMAGNIDDSSCQSEISLEDEIWKP